MRLSPRSGAGTRCRGFAAPRAFNPPGRQQKREARPSCPGPNHSLEYSPTSEIVGCSSEDTPGCSRTVPNTCERLRNSVPAHHRIGALIALFYRQLINSILAVTQEVTQTHGRFDLSQLNIGGSGWGHLQLAQTCIKGLSPGASSQFGGPPRDAPPWNARFMLGFSIGRMACRAPALW